ncbi:MAG: caspase family protein [Microscillaceae bacterium]|jgi:WD40 repeat protein|nr:caspase family protein [Microscillaceae bacterium]
MKKNKLILSLCLFFAGVMSLSAQENHNLIRNYRGAKSGINAVAVSPDMKYIAGGGKDLIIWDLETGREIYNLPNEHPDGLISLAFSPDSKQLVSAGGYDSNHNLKVWNMATGEKTMNLRGHEAVSCIEFSPDGKYLISGGLDKNLMLWDMRLGRSIRTMRGHQEYITDVSFNPSGNLIASSGGYAKTQKGEILLWKIDQVEPIGKIKPALNDHSQAINSIDFSPDGNFLVSASEDGTLKIWETYAGNERKDLTEPYTSLSRVRFSPDGKFIAGASKDKSIRLWEVGSGKRLFTFLGHFREVTALTFSADGKYLISGSMDNSVKLWRAIPYKRMIELYVQDKIKVWQQKGKFEKTVDYQNRVNQTTYERQVQIFSQEAINEMAKGMVNWQIAKSNYDADNETFQLVFRNLNPIYLKVPLNEAQAFDQQISQLKFENPAFTLSSSDDFAILHVELLNPANGKRYNYDSQELVAFNHSDLDIKFEPLDIQPNPNPQQNRPENNPARMSGVSDVDFQLPRTQMNNPDAVAVIIGNAQYQKTKNVDYAIRDARSVRNYLIDVMGYKPGNIIYLENATYTDLKVVFGSKENPKGKLFNMIKPDKSEVFVYYSGHGAPGLNDKKAYFVPTECDPQYVELSGFETDIMYDNLAQLPAKSVVVLLDACFSGENIYKNISPIVIKSKGALGLKNGALLASSAADQVSTWYNEKGHGMFTYFFLKAIHNQNADRNQDKKLTLEEVYNYISDNAEGIPYHARRLHGVQQNPVLKGQNLQKVLVEY